MKPHCYVSKTWSTRSVYFTSITVPETCLFDIVDLVALRQHHTVALFLTALSWVSQNAFCGRVGYKEHLHVNAYGPTYISSYDTLTGCVKDKSGLLNRTH